MRSHINYYLLINYLIQYFFLLHIGVAMFDNVISNVTKLFFEKIGFRFRRSQIKDNKINNKLNLLEIFKKRSIKDVDQILVLGSLILCQAINSINFLSLSYQIINFEQQSAQPEYFEKIPNFSKYQMIKNRLLNLNYMDLTYKSEQMNLQTEAQKRKSENIQMKNCTEQNVEQSQPEQQNSVYQNQVCEIMDSQSDSQSVNFQTNLFEINHGSISFQSFFQQEQAYIEDSSFQFQDCNRKWKERSTKCNNSQQLQVDYDFKLEIKQSKQKVEPKNRQIEQKYPDLQKQLQKEKINLINSVESQSQNPSEFDGDKLKGKEECFKHFVCLITFFWCNSENKIIQTAQGSGFLLNNQMIVSARHNMYLKNEMIRCQSCVIQIRQIDKHGRQRAKQFKSVSSDQWREDKAYDLMVIRLEQKIPNCSYKIQFCNKNDIFDLNLNRRLLIAGYSFQYRTDEMNSKGSLDELKILEGAYKRVNNIYIEYEADTVPGLSGSPIIVKAKDNKFYVAGMHVSRKAPPFKDCRGIMFSLEVVRQINFWMDQIYVKEGLIQNQITSLERKFMKEIQDLRKNIIDNASLFPSQQKIIQYYKQRLKKEQANAKLYSEVVAYLSRVMNQKQIAQFLQQIVLDKEKEHQNLSKHYQQSMKVDEDGKNCPKILDENIKQFNVEQNKIYSVSENQLLSEYSYLKKFNDQNSNSELIQLIDQQEQNISQIPKQQTEFRSMFIINSIQNRDNQSAMMSSQVTDDLDLSKMSSIYSNMRDSSSQDFIRFNAECPYTNHNFMISDQLIEQMVNKHKNMVQLYQNRQKILSTSLIQMHSDRFISMQKIQQRLKFNPIYEKWSINSQEKDKKDQQIIYKNVNEIIRNVQEMKFVFINKKQIIFKDQSNNQISLIH